MKKIITFELQGEEIKAFEGAFKKSGLRSRSEFVRHILKSYTPIEKKRCPNTVDLEELIK